MPFPNRTKSTTQFLKLQRSVFLRLMFHELYMSLLFTIISELLCTNKPYCLPFGACLQGDGLHTHKA